MKATTNPTGATYFRTGRREGDIFACSSAAAVFDRVSTRSWMGLAAIFTAVSAAYA
jgi:hypothetical protein